MDCTISKEINIRLKKGDHEAFLLIYDANVKKMYHFISRYIQSSELIDDIIHDSFLNLWNAKSRLSEDKPVSHYLFRITRNIVFKELKKQVQYSDVFAKVESIEGLNFGEEAVEKSYFEKEYLSIYNLAVNKLPPQRRRIFQMSREEGMSYREIAGDLDISIQTVKEHMSLAMKTMKDYIAKEHDIILKAILFILLFKN